MYQCCVSMHSSFRFARYVNESLLTNSRPHSWQIKKTMKQLTTQEPADLEQLSSKPGGEWTNHVGQDVELRITCPDCTRSAPFHDTERAWNCSLYTPSILSGDGALRTFLSLRHKTLPWSKSIKTTQTEQRQNQILVQSRSRKCLNQYSPDMASNHKRNACDTFGGTVLHYTRL